MHAGEKDPNGIEAHVAGAKLDAGKIKLYLLRYFSRSVKALADLATKGAVKYSPGGFLEVPEGVNRYTDAMLGHWLDELDEDFVSDMPAVLHATAVAWNAMARLELILRERGEFGPGRKSADSSAIRTGGQPIQDFAGFTSRKKPEDCPTCKWKDVDSDCAGKLRGPCPHWKAKGGSDND